MTRNKMVKHVVAGILTAVMLMTGVSILLNNEAHATGLAEMPASEDDKVWYVQTSGSDFKALYITQNKTAPTKEGYLFGGWYKDQGSTVITAETAGDVADSDTVYAKFVPAYVLSIKAQNYAATAETSDMTGSTTSRVVSSIDESLLYSEVGFEVEIKGKDPVSVPITKVWKKLAVGTGESKKTYEASQIFGKTAKHFFVLNITDIPETKWGEAIYVRPYWVTEDGTKVEGLSKYVFVEDGVKGYISVPINLNNVTKGMAAGFLKVDYDSSLTFKECVVGRVFEEMEINCQDSSVKCVGNVSTLADVKKDDMYITLRFEMPKGAQLEEQDFYKFAVSAEDFISVNENDVTLNVWDIQY